MVKVECLKESYLEKSNITFARLMKFLKLRSFGFVAFETRLVNNCIYFGINQKMKWFVNFKSRKIIFQDVGTIFLY